MPNADRVGVIETDALVIGAGPVGLFQVFQLGLLGVSAHVVDALPIAGGQCIELYADKPIYDIPAVQVCTGRELVARLLAQIEPFAASFHLHQTVVALSPRRDGNFDLETSSGQRFVSRTVFIAAGVGAFQPRSLQVEGYERHLGRQIFHHGPDATLLSGQRVLVLGDDDEAVNTALALAHRDAAHRPTTVTLLHRRKVLSAEPETMTRFQQLCDTGALRFEVGQVLALEEANGTDPGLTAVHLIGEDGQPRRIAVDVMLMRLGLSPKLGPIAQWGLAMARRQLTVDTASFETSTPGIYAVGDVVSYPGKKKLIVSGFHEATLAAYAAAARLRPDEPVLLQYTTTSPRLQQRLGVAARAN